jgi:hypothetical protein
VGAGFGLGIRTILRQKGTEASGTDTYEKHSKEGVYLCVAPPSLNNSEEQLVDPAGSQWMDKNLEANSPVLADLLLV